MNKLRIVSTGPVLPITQEVLSRFGSVEIAAEMDEVSLISLMSGTIGLISRGVIPISARVIQAGAQLRVIGRTGAGYDNVDIEAATKRGIPVVFAPGAGAKAVAEGAMAFILSLVKRLPQLHAKTCAGEWSTRDTMSIGDLQGAVVGIVGLGRIGREVARMAQVFDVRVLCYDPLVTTGAADELRVQMVDLETLLKESDVITIHASMNSQTRGMFNANRIGMIKKGAIFINLARGGLLESLDLLYDALKSGRLSAVGLDVFPMEPPDFSHPIFSHPNVLCTPHAMGLSVKAAQATFSMVCRGMAHVFEGGAPQNVVNPEVFNNGQK